MQGPSLSTWTRPAGKFNIVSIMRFALFALLLAGGEWLQCIPADAQALTTGAQSPTGMGATSPLSLGAPGVSTRYPHAIAKDAAPAGGHICGQPPLCRLPLLTPPPGVQS